ncbi:MAG: ATPase, T2SS/T4P/T4SS family [Eubacteriales bacterium]
MSIINTKSDLDNLLLSCIELNGTDLHFSVGAYPAVRIHGEVKYLKTEQRVMTEDVENIMEFIVPVGKFNDYDDFHNSTFSYSIAGKGRFRVNIFKQRNSYCASFRIGNFYCPSKEELRLPDEIDNVFTITSGLIIISGPIGSGRTNTGAYILDKMRQEKAYFIDTVEDPIEFLFRHDKSVINQMEIGIDVAGILDGLKISLKNYSDVIFLSSFVDKDVIKMALEATRAGRIIIAVGEVQGVEEVLRSIVDIFPNEQANYIRTLLSHSIKCIISQQLIPDVEDNPIPLCEILYGIKAATNLIRENKIPQISRVLEASESKHMLSIDNHLTKLYNDGHITIDTAKDFSQNWNVLSQKLVKKK